MERSQTVKTVFLSALALVLWGLYFAVAASPVGATFIYAAF